jgi:Flp pilus assembly protein CpaB
LNRSRLFIVAGVVLAIVAFMAVLAFSGPAQPAAPAAPTTAKVVVAATDIALGTHVTVELLTTEDRPIADTTDSYTDPAQVVGSVARQTITHGTVVHSASFQNQTTTNGGANVVGALKPGLLGIAVPLDKVASVAYLIQPGDWVDVLIALEDTDELNPVVVQSTGDVPYVKLNEYLNSTSVKVLVQNVQVLATAELPTAEPNNQVLAAPAGDPAFVAVLAVTPQQAELIRFAQLDGNLSVVLRSPDDAGASEVATNGVTLYELVHKWGVLSPLPVVPGVQ